MPTGYFISGTAHLLFIAFLLFGGIFSRDRLPPVTVADVALISEAEFAALFPPQSAPEIAPEPDQPAAPTIEAPEQDAPAPEPAPEVAVLPAPVIETPPPPDRPEAPQESAPAPAPRVAPEPAAPSEPAVQDAPVRVEQTAPEPAAETPAPEAEAAAPQEATTEIVTEAEKPKVAAPAASPRPRNRPARPEPAPETETAEDPTAAAIAEAVAAANVPVPTPAAPSGPPLTGGEKDALRVAVQRCWNVGSLSSEALRSTVIVAVSMSRDGTPEAGSIRMLDFDGGSEAGARQAFEAARRAIIRCGASGYNLPVEKFDQWRDIEMTFNPERMRIK